MLEVSKAGENAKQTILSSRFVETLINMGNILDSYKSCRIGATFYKDGSETIAMGHLESSAFSNLQK